MQVSAIGRAAIASREGDELVAYKDSVGVWTISVGITTASGLITVTPGLRISQATSNTLFEKAVEKYATPVRNALKRPCTQEQFDALVSLCYNIGPGALASSTVVKRFNAGDVAGAAEAILMWNKPAVIQTRRRAEYEQFKTPYLKALPKGRSNDKTSLKAPSFVPAPPVPAPSPIVAAPAQPGSLWSWLVSKVSAR